jgi:circadian clock protein KaiB
MKTKINQMRIQDAVPDWNLLLYVAGLSTKSADAYRNLRRICDQHLAGRYHIQVIDLMKNPQIARDQQIIAVPTVVRKSPDTIRRVIGDLSNTERVLAGLQIPRHDEPLIDRAPGNWRNLLRLAAPQSAIRHSRSWIRSN